ncbi:HNH endonuclease [Aquimarina sp. AD10]|uniref:HNH endonuclease n=1 Tax=Aquimarina sp. AD10 TaxID=1714849 RepID=UPI000E53571E|nr:HNH endonuclease [Aquimarina sp. AD10]AXT63760.1 HNH endonuclease [Aquimarina sp. AD10]RKN00749.1 HNH endonuclease [Aquimarina sp. AD10]
MRKITNEMVEKAFEIGKKIYHNQLSRKEGISILEKMGMKESSAHDYIYSYFNLIQGKLFTRTTSAYGTEYFLERIYNENGISGLKNALLALSQHFDYYEEISGGSIKKRKEIYNRYYDLVKDSYDNSVYADEVDPNQKYSEGKTKQVVVNNYERNPIARKKCIEHFGLDCQVCGFNFEEKFGELGKDFIHVHHKVDIASIGNEYSINPITDLIPVCPNCHSMLHKKKPSYSIEELKSVLK